jgi:hypothetical protein
MRKPQMLIALSLLNTGFDHVRDSCSCSFEFRSSVMGWRCAIRSGDAISLRANFQQTRCLILLVILRR